MATMTEPERRVKQKQHRLSGPITARLIIVDVEEDMLSSEGMLSFPG